jgi:hypothetical protein
MYVQGLFALVPKFEEATMTTNCQIRKIGIFVKSASKESKEAVSPFSILQKLRSCLIFWRWVASAGLFVFLWVLAGSFCFH